MYIMWIREITGPERVIFEGVVPSSKEANYVYNCVYKAHKHETVLEYQLLEDWRIDHVLKGLEGIDDPKAYLKFKEQSAIMG